MASSKDYLSFVIEQLSDLGEINYRAMMGEYIIYYRGKVAGGIYDDRFLVKTTQAAIAYIGDVTYAVPYPGGKEMILVENLDDKSYLGGLFKAMYDELPAPKNK